jgi:hypothetical protein
MMVLSAARPDASLREFLVQRARESSLVRLGGDIAAGVAGASITLFWWRPESKLLLLSGAVAFVAYGAWGIADRFRTSLSLTNRFAEKALMVVCALLAVAGVLAGAGIIYGVWSLALGTWIS